MDLSEFDIDFLSQKLSDNPQSPLFARLADLYLSKNQSSEALKLCEDGVRAYSSYATGYVILGKCYLALNENSKARLAFSQALHLAPFNQVARKLLSEIPAGGEEPVAPPIQEAPVESTPTVEAQPVPEPVLPEPVIPEPPPIEAIAPTVVDVPEPVVEQIVEAPSNEMSIPEVAEQVTQEVVQPEVAAVPEPPPAEPAEMLSLDEYLQRHSANVPSEKMISLDEYLGVAAQAPVSVPTPTPTPSTELDSLAAQLENAARITPPPPEPEAAPQSAPPLDTTVITPTLAEIYASQGEYGAAIQAYEILLLSKPDDRPRFEKRIKELQAKLYDGG